MFQDKLKELRTNYGMTQKELAEELGTSQQSYMKWETGKTSPTLKTLNKIAHFFNIPTSSLLGDNSLDIKDILDKEYLYYDGEDMKPNNELEFREYVADYIYKNLGDPKHRNSGRFIKLKSGKIVSYNREASLK